MPITIKEITAYDSGAQFYAADLHIHSYGASEDVSDSSLTIHYIIETAFKNKVPVLAITDHNTARNVEPSIEYAAKYPGQMLVLAGVEITTASGHLLAYFPPNDFGHVQDLLSRINIIGRPGARNSHTTMSMADVIKEVERLNGIAIAAHVDRVNTGFEMKESGYPNWKTDIIVQPGLYGLEFDDAQHLSWYSPEDTEPNNGAERKKILRARIAATRRLRLAAIQDSDAHTSADLLQFTTKSPTRLKMNTLTYDAFRTALIDAEARVRAQATIPNAFSQIIGMYCEGGFLDGEGIHFSRNLNCFIGGRGTGKSTAIRSLAYALDVDDDFEAYDNCPDLVVAYCLDANGIVYRYERQKGLSTTARAWDGSNIQDVPTDAFRIEFYQQGALAEVAKDPLGNPKLLQEFLDKHISLEDLRSRESGTLYELEQNSALLKPLEVAASQLTSKQTALSGFNAKLKAAESGNIKEIAALQTQIAAEKSLIRSLDEIRAFYERGNISVAPLLRDYDALATAAGTPTSDPDCKNQLNLAKQEIDEANNLLKAHEQQMRAELKRVGQKLAAALTTLRVRHTFIDRSIEEAVERLRKQGLAASINELNTLIRQRDLASAEVARITRQRSQLQELRDARANLLSELAGVRNEIASRRKGQCATINQNFGRSISDYFVALFYDRTGITDEFCDLILSKMHGSYLPEETVRLMCAALSPEQLVDFVRRGDTSWLAALGKIESKWAIEIISRFRLIENLHLLGTVSKPPLPVIKVLTRTTPPRQIPVSHLSDGQKHTILLTIALLAESNVPLVIDQPEDDLDNAFIFSNVVTTLRRIKESRQLIIVTHNANLAVLGDSELLLPLKRTGDKGAVYERGSIDRTETSAVVQEILEGGSLAFLRRKDIYGY
jgi:predicted metal-dependent phosphoesterase TrpH